MFLKYSPCLRHMLEEVWKPVTKTVLHIYRIWKSKCTRKNNIYKQIIFYTRKLKNWEDIWEK
jgi:hypothetical protein